MHKGVKVKVYYPFQMLHNWTQGLYHGTIRGGFEDICKNKMMESLV